MGNTGPTSLRSELGAVYPHGCGEYSGVGWRFIRSSPVHLHGCGEYSPCPPHTPATSVHPHGCGEYTADNGATVPREAVHPHGCGEYPFSEGAGFENRYGSPPRLWGICRTPRNGGKHSTVHPHGCGEYVRSKKWTWNTSGAMPTAVGNTAVSLMSSVRAILRFTPHGCGEYVKSAAELLRRFGSPPRLWGIHDGCARGWLFFGSPPRLWGIRNGGGQDENRRRFTPTAVGNTCGTSARSPLPGGSPPRGCGEDAVVLQVVRSSRGSPPRLWGIPSHSPCTCLDFRPGSPPRLWGIRFRTAQPPPP